MFGQAGTEHYQVKYVSGGVHCIDHNFESVLSNGQKRYCIIKNTPYSVIIFLSKKNRGQISSVVL